MDTHVDGAPAPSPFYADQWRELAVGWHELYRRQVRFTLAAWTITVLVAVADLVGVPLGVALALVVLALAGLATAVGQAFGTARSVR